MPAPNILLLTIDTLRADILACYGYPRPVSPFLDSLAAHGIRFDQAISGGSWTQAAFPVILTSTHASHHGGCLGPLSPLRPSPIEALAGHGYFTFGISSSPLLSGRYGYNRGFGVFADLDPSAKDPALRRIRGGQSLLRQPWLHDLAGLFGGDLRPAPLYVSAAEINARAIGLIEQADRPFFGWLHYMDVHWPYHRTWELEGSREIAGAWRDLIHLHRVNRKDAAISAEQKRHYLGLYEQAVAYIDDQIRRLFEFLQSAGIAGETVVIIVSDHGEEFLERGRWGHFETNLHDEIIRVPLLIRLPGHEEGLVIRRQVSTLDLMPTVLELCGCPLPDGLIGRSLQPLWTGGGGSHPGEPAISEMWRGEWHIVAIRTPEFKFIWDSRRPEAPALFDLVRDPAEREDVAGRFPDRTAGFRDQLDRHLQRAAATSPSSAGSAPALDGDLAQRLQDLGYLG